MSFKLGRRYTRDQINAAVGGSKQSYLPTVCGRVVCGAFTRRLNPEVPSVVLAGYGPQIERTAEIFQKMVTDQLQTAMDKNRATLVKALLPAVAQSPPKSWRKYGQGLHTDAVRQLLSNELNRVFGNAADVVGEMRVHVVFKGVTYQSLIDPGFQALVKAKLPFLPATHEEHAAAPEAART